MDKIVFNKDNQKLAEAISIQFRKFHECKLPYSLSDEVIKEECLDWAKLVVMDIVDAGYRLPVSDEKLRGEVAKIIWEYKEPLKSQVIGELMSLFQSA